MSTLSKLNTYFTANRTVTTALLWISFSIALGYALLALLVFPAWNFWLMFIPGIAALYFRIMYARATYDPMKDKLSKDYVPYKQRPQQKKKKKK